jgi:hypothetical protein
VHVPPFGPEKPALQTQAVLAVLVAGEVEFLGQVEHAVEPATANVPDKHCKHGSPAGLAYPALQGTGILHSLPRGHVVSVRSTPFRIASVMAVVALGVRYSSTTNIPATSAFNATFGNEKLGRDHIDWPMYILFTVLSLITCGSVVVVTIPFTFKECRFKDF